MTHVGETGALQLELAVSRTLLGMEPYRLQLTQPSTKSARVEATGWVIEPMAKLSSRQVRLM
jgi:hypothetical protein